MKNLLKNQKKKDYFGFQNQAKNYAQFRPNYPHKFLDLILSDKALINLPRRRCLDVATGTGFIASKLSQQFDQVIGIDISSEQLQQAKTLYTDIQNLEFKVQSIEDYLEQVQKNETKKPNLITIAQALHWFKDIPQVLKNLNQLLDNDSKLVIITYLQQNIFINQKQIEEYKQVLNKKNFQVNGNFHDIKIDYSNNKDIIKLNDLYENFFELIKPHFKFDRTIIDRYYEPLNLEKQTNVVQKISYVDFYNCKNLTGYLNSVSGYNCYLKDKNIKKGSENDPLVAIQEQLNKMSHRSVDMITTYLAFIVSKQIIQKVQLKFYDQKFTKILFLLKDLWKQVYKILIIQNLFYLYFFQIINENKQTKTVSLIASK